MAVDSTGVDDTVVTAKNVDFSNCDRELVQFPGAIQPHGAMLVVDEPDYTVIQASANCEELLGRPLDQGVGARIKDLFDDSAERLGQLHRMPLDQTPCRARVFRRLRARREHLRPSLRRPANPGA